MEAVARELVGWHVVANLAGRCGIGDQAFNQVAQVVLGAGDVGAAMEDGRELGAVMLVLDERVGLQHSVESLGGTAGPISDSEEMLEVGAHLAFVPRQQDRVDI